MTYVISDIHGCYNEYLEALKRIDFSDEDTLYVLGDCVDRGYAPIKVLQHMMARPNIIPIIGNHDFTALVILKKFCVEVTEENFATQISDEDIEDVLDWILNGGQRTIEDFRKLSAEERQEILEYLGEFSVYEEVEAGGKNYLLVHGGLEPFNPELDVEDYALEQVVLSRPDYDKAYYEDRFTVTGHTPTPTEEGNSGTIIKRNNHIAIDCGCVFGYNLAVLCLETGEETYVPFIGEE